MIIGILSIALLLIYLPKSQQHTDKVVDNVTDQVVSTGEVSPQNISLTKEDSEQISKELIVIEQRMINIHKISEKAKSQCNRFMNLYLNFSVSAYDVYMAAEVAKETLKIGKSPN